MFRKKEEEFAPMRTYHDLEKMVSTFLTKYPESFSIEVQDNRIYLETLLVNSQNTSRICFFLNIIPNADDPGDTEINFYFRSTDAEGKLIDKEEPGYWGYRVKFQRNIFKPKILECLNIYQGLKLLGGELKIDTLEINKQLSNLLSKEIIYLFTRVIGSSRDFYDGWQETTDRNLDTLLDLLQDHNPKFTTRQVSRQQQHLSSFQL